MISDDDRRCGMRLARNQAEPTLPRLERFIQFRLCPFALGKYPFRLAVGQMTRHFEQSVQTSHRSGSNDVIPALQPLDLAVGDGDFRQVKVSDHTPQEVGTKPARFVQGHRPTAQDGDDDTRKARPGTDVEPVPLFIGKAKQLGAVENVPVPELRDAARGNQILPSIFVDQKGRKAVELFECFTWNIHAQHIPKGCELGWRAHGAFISNHAAARQNQLGGPDWCSAQVHLDADTGTVWSTCMDNGLLMLKFTAVMLPYVMLVCGGAFLSAILQVHKRFGPPAFAPILLNVCHIGVVSIPMRNNAITIGSRPQIAPALSWRFHLRLFDWRRQ